MHAGARGSGHEPGEVFDGSGSSLLRNGPGVATGAGQTAGPLPVSRGVARPGRRASRDPVAGT